MGHKRNSLREESVKRHIMSTIGHTDESRDDKKLGVERSACITTSMAAGPVTLSASLQSGRNEAKQSIKIKAPFISAENNFFKLDNYGYIYTFQFLHYQLEKAGSFGAAACLLSRILRSMAENNNERERALTQ